MKLVEFTYTKSDGTTTNRAVIELQQPSQHFEGLDVSELPEVQFAEFVQEYRELLNQQHEAKMALLARHDLKHNYRRFLPKQMSAVTTEHI